MWLKILVTPVSGWPRAQARSGRTREPPLTCRTASHTTHPANLRGATPLFSNPAGQTSQIGLQKSPDRTEPGTRRASVVASEIGCSVQNRVVTDRTRTPSLGTLNQSEWVGGVGGLTALA